MYYCITQRDHYGSEDVILPLFRLTHIKEQNVKQYIPVSSNSSSLCVRVIVTVVVNSRTNSSS